MHCDFSRTRTMNRLNAVETKPEMDTIYWCPQKRSTNIDHSGSTASVQLHCSTRKYSWPLFLAIWSFLGAFVGKFYYLY